ncbi:copper homeostasis protein CutC [Reinekea sp.]|uniref:copper homeostasis protein CutC n=1 Tax=Reinekea sp. TaxID=1970455 RepID=UPI0039894BAF
MVLLEICVDTINGLHTAVDNGADRIELCSALSVGGLSPSFALLTEAQKVGVPVHVMVRPRAGSFKYSPEEIDGMIQEIIHVKSLGLSGVVFGVGTEVGLDWPALKQLCLAAAGLDITVHRVVDLLTPEDRLAALPKLGILGVDRVLTSGGLTKAVDSIPELKQLIGAAPENMVVMPGSGVTASNIEEILAETSATEIHTSAGIKTDNQSAKSLELGFENINSRETSASLVRLLKSLC